MKSTNFASLYSAKKRALLERVYYCEAQTEAARALLAKAIADQFEPTFWADALDFAEAEEARARRNLVKWQSRDQDAARRNFEFERALSPATARALESAREAA